MASSVISTSPKTIETPSNYCKPSHEYDFCFPDGFIIRLSSEQSVDLSGIEIDLSDIFVGGIGYGGGASKLLARTMQDIGSEENVYNAPFCIEDGGAVISPEDRFMMKETVQAKIAEAIHAGCTYINIPINLGGHASLATIVVTQQTALLRFYDSLAPSISSYDSRYDEMLMNTIRSLLPSSLSIAPEKPEVLHLLSQGGIESSGCGYYALYTALLIKESKEIRELAFFHEKPLLDETADQQIRANLVIRSLLAKGLDNVDTSFSTLSKSYRDHLYQRIGFSVKNLIKALKPRL